MFLQLSTRWNNGQNGKKLDDHISIEKKLE